MIFYLFHIVMILDQSVHNLHKGRPFLVNDCAVALNKIMYFNCFELVNSHFITTKNNLHYQQLTIVRPKVVHRAIKCIRDGQHQRMREWGQNGNSQATKISLFLFRRSLLLLSVGNLGGALLANPVVAILQNIGTVGGRLRELVCSCHFDMCKW